MKTPLALIVLLLCTFNQASMAQVQILDVDAYQGAFNLGTYYPEIGDYVFRVNEVGSNATINVLTLDTGITRELNTPGIDADTFGENNLFGGQILVHGGLFSSTINVFSVDYTGNSPPISMLPEPGENTVGILAPNGGQVVLLVSGDPLSSNPSERDRLYTRSILGGPATEILGGLPQFREVSTALFSETGDSLLVFTNNGFGGPTPEKLFLARPGVTALTQVLAHTASNVEYRALGGDAAGEYFVVERGFEGSFGNGLLWSVPVNNLSPPPTAGRACRPFGHHLSFRSTRQNWGTPTLHK